MNLVPFENAWLKGADCATPSSETCTEEDRTRQTLEEQK